MIGGVAELQTTRVEEDWRTNEPEISILDSTFIEEEESTVTVPVMVEDGEEITREAELARVRLELMTRLGEVKFRVTRRRPQ